MRGDLKDIFAWLHGLPHPSKATLMAALDAELAPGQHARVEHHLAKCSLCRAHLEELREGLRSFDRSVAGTRVDFSLERGFEKIVSAIQARGGFADVRSLLHEKKSPVYASLSSELSIYLGSHAATQLLDRCGDSLSRREELNEAVAPVVVAFLGQHTGSAVLANVLRIWDQAHEVAS